MIRHNVSSWEKEWDFKPNVQRAKDDWLDPVTPTYIYPPRDGRSDRRNDYRFKQDTTLGVSLTREPAWKKKFPPTSEREEMRRTQPRRTDPVVGESGDGVLTVKKSVYRPHSAASSRPTSSSRAKSSGQRQGRVGSVNPDLHYDGRPESAMDEREFGTHPPQSMERMYRESIRNRRTEHLRNHNHVEPEWERQREVMDIVGAKSAEDLIDGGYDPRYRQPGTMLDVRRSRRVMSEKDRSSMAYRMFPENYKSLQGRQQHDDGHYDEAERSASHRRAASAHASRAATTEELSRSHSRRQRTASNQSVRDTRWEEQEGRSAYHSLGGVGASSQIQRRVPSKRAVSGFRDDREEQDARARREQLDMADQRARLLNQSRDQANAVRLADALSPNRADRYNTVRANDLSRTHSSSFVNNIRSTTANSVQLPTYSSPLRDRTYHGDGGSRLATSIHTPSAASTYYRDRLAAHRPFEYPSTHYEAVSTQHAPASTLYPPEPTPYVAHSYDRFRDVMSQFGTGSPMRDATNTTYYPHQPPPHRHQQLPLLQTVNSFYSGETGPIVVTAPATQGVGGRTVFHSSIHPVEQQPPAGVAAATPAVYCATGHFYLNGEGSPPRTDGYREGVSAVHGYPHHQSHISFGGTSILSPPRPL